MKGKHSFELAIQDQFANMLFVKKHLELIVCGPRNSKEHSCFRPVPSSGYFLGFAELAICSLSFYQIFFSHSEEICHLLLSFVVCYLLNCINCRNIRIP